MYSFHLTHCLHILGVKSTLAEITQVQEGKQYGLMVGDASKGADDMLWLEDGDHPLNAFDIQQAVRSCDRLLCFSRLKDVC